MEGLQGRVIHCSVPISHGGVIEEGVVLEFTVETQSNNLAYHQTYSKRQ